MRASASCRGPPYAARARRSYVRAPYVRDLREPRKSTPPGAAPDSLAADALTCAYLARGHMGPREARYEVSDTPMAARA